MSLSRTEIIQKQKDYFASELASEPAIIEAGGVYGDNLCVYKTADGRGCMIGCLFLDKPELYDPEWDASDGLSVNSLSDTAIAYMGGAGQENMRFLSDTQNFHDQAATEWVYRESINNTHFGKWFLKRLKDRWPAYT